MDVDLTYTLSTHELEALSRLAQTVGLDTADPEAMDVMAVAKVRIDRLTQERDALVAEQSQLRDVLRFVLDACERVSKITAEQYTYDQLNDIGYKAEHAALDREGS